MLNIQDSHLKKKKFKSKKTKGGLVALLILKGNKLSLVSPYSGYPLDLELVNYNH